MDNAPWLTPAKIALAHDIVRSHRSAFGAALLATPAARNPASYQRIQPANYHRLLAQELFAAATVVLAHDCAPLEEGEGPRLIYANRAALTLWRRDWDAMVGMPSSRTAEPAHRTSRRQALVGALQQQAISNYNGIRIDSSGRRFAINGARIWTLRDASGQTCGQAAAFSCWWWL